MSRLGEKFFSFRRDNSPLTLIMDRNLFSVKTSGFSFQYYYKILVYFFREGSDLVADRGNHPCCPEAKAWFDTYFPYYGDVARLGSNGDGEPCESLPGGS